MSSFSIEVQPLETPSTLLDSSVFLTDPFTFDSMDNIEDVPVTDTRQSSSVLSSSSDKIVQTGINLNVNVGLNTLTSSVNDNISNSSFSNSNNDVGDETSSAASLLLPSSLTTDDLSSLQYINSDDRTIGCSKFFVTDLGSGGSSSSTCTTNKCSTMNLVTQSKNRSVVSSTLTSSKNNHSVNTTTMTESKIRNVSGNEGGGGAAGGGGTIGSTNGLLSQFGYDGNVRIFFFIES